jgi:hypothetical protein
MPACPAAAAGAHKQHDHGDDGRHHQQEGAGKQAAPRVFTFACLHARARARDLRQWTADDCVPRVCAHGAHLTTNAETNRTDVADHA